MKKLLTILICFAIICTLCACGERGELPTPPSVTPSAAPSASPSVDPTEVAEWMLEVERGNYNVEVTDADGADISDRVVELWVRANRAYGGLDFTAADADKLADGDFLAADFDSVMSGIFTEDGVAQVLDTAEGANDTIFTKTEDGVYVPGENDYYARTYVLNGIQGVETVSASDDRIELIVSAFISYDSGSALLCEKMPFTLAKEDGVWLVDSYRPYGTRLVSEDTPIAVAYDVEAEYDGLLDDALLAVRSTIVGYENAGVEIAEASLDGIVEVARAEADNGDVAMVWRLEFSLRTDGYDANNLGGRSLVENGWITRGSDGDRYLVGYAADGAWHTIGMPSEVMAEQYDTFDNREAYDSFYAAMLDQYYSNGADDGSLADIVVIPTPKHPDLSEFDIVEDGSAEYPVVIKRLYAVNMGDGAVELAMQYFEMLSGEPRDEMRALRLEDIYVAEGKFGDDLLAVYRFNMYVTMQDGMPPAGGIWEEDLNDYGWYSDDYSSEMQAVTLNGELVCLADFNLLWQGYGVAHIWHTDEEKEAVLRAVYEEYIADDPQGGYAFELSPTWETHRLLYGGTIEVLDADGRDVTDEFYELWQAAESAYGAGFEHGGSEVGVYEAIPMLSGYKLLGVEETLDEIFTENGKAQILDAVEGGLPLLMHREEDDSWWHPEPRNSGWDTHLLTAETTAVSDGRIELLLTYGFRGSGIDRQTSRFVMVETADGWKVDDFPTFKCRFGAEHLLRVLDGYDASFIRFTPADSRIELDDPRFLGGFNAEIPVIGRATKEDGKIAVWLYHDPKDLGLGYSPDGSMVYFVVDLERGMLGGHETYTYEKAPSSALEFTESELLSWGLMLADVITEAEAELLAEQGE